MVNEKNMGSDSFAGFLLERYWEAYAANDEAITETKEREPWEWLSVPPQHSWLCLIESIIQCTFAEI